MNHEILAEAVVSRAILGSFTVARGALNSLVLTHPAVEGWELERAGWKARGQVVLAGVRQTSRWPKELEPRQLVTGELFMCLLDVEIEFLNSLEGVLARRSEDLAIYAELGLRFDEKVESEMLADPELRRIEVDIEAARERWKTLVLELEERKNQLRAQSEGAREPFLFVSDGRGI